MVTIMTTRAFLREGSFSEVLRNVITPQYVPRLSVPKCIFFRSKMCTM